MKATITLIMTFMLSGLLWGPFGGEAISQIRYVPDNGSKLWIEGSSNVNRFQCDAEEVEGRALVFSQMLSQVPGTVEQSNRGNELSIRVDVAVDGFECGRSRMNRDLREALQSQEFPKITFIYGSATPVNGSETENETGRVTLEVIGSLTVAGTTRDIRFIVEGTYMEDGRIQATGKKEIKMSDFGVDPPTAMLGMVKARDELTVHFDLIAKQDETE